MYNRLSKAENDMESLNGPASLCISRVIYNGFQKYAVCKTVRQGLFLT